MSRKLLHRANHEARKSRLAQTKWVVAYSGNDHTFRTLKKALCHFHMLPEELPFATLEERNTDQYLLEYECGMVYVIDQGDIPHKRKLSARHIGRVQNYKCWRKK